MSAKRSILFVDDEQYVLDGLRRMLRGMRNEWDMTFVDSGRLALEIMGQKPFDVIVSDMRMPDMNGAVLLNEVMRLHPRTVRLVLSGHADDELIMQCVNATHQFLAKPCEAELIRATIERLCVIESRSQDERIVAITSKLDRLPSIPVLYDELLAKVRDPDASVEAIAGVVSRDPAMSAKILKLVNSAFFGLRRRVVDMVDAVSFLGLDTLRSLALSVQAFSQFDKAESLVIDVAELWKHSLATAAGARAIAELELCDHGIRGETFTAGLLHDMGRLVLAANFPDAYREVEKDTAAEAIALSAAEIRHIGFDHAEVGSVLFGIWGLPDGIVECAGLHHHPSKSTHAARNPLTFVHAADAWLESDPASADTDVPQLDHAYLEKLEVDNLAAWRQAVVSVVGGPKAHATADTHC